MSHDHYRKNVSHLDTIAWTALGAVAYGLCRLAVFFVTDAFEDVEE